MGLLYDVDDTDLMIMEELIRSPYDLWEESHEACTAWEKNLIATGGTPSQRGDSNNWLITSGRRTGPDRWWK